MTPRLPRSGRRLLASAATALVLVALHGCGASTIPPVHSEGERLANARGAMERRDYHVAIELLKSFIANNAGSREVDEAIYRLGMCYLGIKEHASAQVEFERLLRDYPESDSSASAAFRLGEALWGQSRPPDFDQEFTQKALDQWQVYLRRDPDHWLAPQGHARIGEARQRLATRLAKVGMLYLKLKLPRPARIYFERLTGEFGDTPPAAEGRLGLALCLAQEGKRAEALAALRAFEQETGQGRLHERAVKERRRLERQG